MISLPTFLLSTGSSLTAGSAGSSPNSAGATISGGVLTLQPADATNPGIVSTGTQTIAGAKTLTGALTVNNSSGVTITGPASSADALIVPSGSYINFAGGTAQGRISWDGSAYLVTSNYMKVPLLVVTGGSISPNSSTTLSLNGNAANGATAKAVRIASTQNLTTAGAKVVTFENNAGSTELASITSYGAFRMAGMTTTARDALGAADKVAGSIIYNTTTNKLNFYNGSAWEVVTSA